MAARNAWSGQGSRHERGYGSAWVKLRQSIMDRDQWLCQPCLSRGRPTPATEVDHIKPKAKGGTDASDNLQAICRDCHEAKSSVDRGERARRQTGADGWPIA